jgi:hypothetical protein
MDAVSHRNDKLLNLFFGFMLGLAVFACVFLFVQWLGLTLEDKIRAGGTAVGAFFTSMIAVLLYWSTNRRKKLDEQEELEQIKRAIWQDIRATLQVIFREYEEWSSEDFLGDDDRFGVEVEHLRPTVFDAVIDKIGKLEEEQSYHLLLVHDNLRSVREAMKAFSYKPSEIPAARGYSAEERARLRERLLEDARVIAELLETVCVDADHVLKSLDPTGEYDRRFNTMRRRPGADTAWRDRLDELVRRNEAQAPAYNF